MNTKSSSRSNDSIDDVVELFIYYYGLFVILHIKYVYAAPWRVLRANYV